MCFTLINNVPSGGEYSHTIGPSHFNRDEIDDKHCYGHGHLHEGGRDANHKDVFKDDLTKTELTKGNGNICIPLDKKPVEEKCG